MFILKNSFNFLCCNNLLQIHCLTFDFCALVFASRPRVINYGLKISYAKMNANWEHINLTLSGLALFNVAIYVLSILTLLFALCVITDWVLVQLQTKPILALYVSLSNSLFGMIWNLISWDRTDGLFWQESNNRQFGDY